MNSKLYYLNLYKTYFLFNYLKEFQSIVKINIFYNFICLFLINLLNFLSFINYAHILKGHKNIKNAVFEILYIK